ncbi:MAG: hypothetical protein AB7G93_12920 [Bdellovibrionales bacterium]
MIRLKALSLLIIATFSSHLMASSPQEVCDTIRSHDTHLSTEQNADRCDSLVAQGFFDEAAAHVCLTIAKGDKFGSTQENAISCLRAVRDKAISFAAIGGCQEIADEDTFGSTQMKAIEVTLSELGGQALAPDQDLSLKVGRIKFIATAPPGPDPGGASFSYGLRVDE